MLWFAKSQHAKLPIHSRQKKMNMNILSQRLEILETLLSQRCVSKKGLWFPSFCSDLLIGTMKRWLWLCWVFPTTCFDLLGEGHCCPSPVTVRSRVGMRSCWTWPGQKSRKHHPGQISIIPKHELRGFGGIPLLNHHLRWPRLRSF